MCKASDVDQLLPGIVLDAEGCKRADELHGLSVLITTLVKAGRGSVQVIAAGEGSLELSQSIPRSTMLVPPSTRYTLYDLSSCSKA